MHIMHWSSSSIVVETVERFKKPLHEKTVLLHFFFGIKSGPGPKSWCSTGSLCSPALALLVLFNVYHVHSQAQRETRKPAQLPEPQHGHAWNVQSISKYERFESLLVIPHAARSMSIIMASDNVKEVSTADLSQTSKDATHASCQIMPDERIINNWVICNVFTMHNA